MKFAGHAPDIQTDEASPSRREKLDELIVELEETERHKREIISEISKLSEE